MTGITTLKGSKPMKLLAKVAFGSLASVLLISGIAVMTPRAVQAVVATIIRDQDNPARHPLTKDCASDLTTGQIVVCTTSAIPAGQQFVIETISILASSDPSNFVLENSVEITTAGPTTSFSLNPIFDDGVGQPTEARYLGVQSLRLYADPGSTIQCIGATKGTNPSGQLFLDCTISGYFVTLP